MCINAFPSWMCVYHMHTWCLRKSNEGVRSFEAAVTGRCEPSHCKSRLCGASFSFILRNLYVHMCVQFYFLTTPPPLFGIAILGFILSADLIVLGLFKSSATLHSHLGPQLILDGEFDCRDFISENCRLCWWLLRKARDGTTSASLSSQLSVQISAYSSQYTQFQL